MEKKRVAVVAEVLINVQGGGGRDMVKVRVAFMLC